MAGSQQQQPHGACPAHMAHMLHVQLTWLTWCISSSRGVFWFCDASLSALQAEGLAWQAVNSSSLLPCFLQTLHQALEPSRSELAGNPVNFSSAWSVLMFALASTEPSFSHPALR